MGHHQVNERGTVLAVQLSDEVYADFLKLSPDQQAETVLALEMVMRMQAYVLASIARGHKRIFNLVTRARVFNTRVQAAITEMLRS